MADTGSSRDRPRGLPSSLAPYLELLARLDAHDARLRGRYGDRIACGEGCAECCTLGSVFAIEAFNISRFASAVPAGETGRPGGLGRAERPGDACPFLAASRCSVYPARPVICRTHGFPLLIEGSVDFCPKNFAGTVSIESGYILDLEGLNALLASMNALFLRETGDPFFKRERVPLGEIRERAGENFPFPFRPFEV